MTENTEVIAAAASVPSAPAPKPTETPSDGIGGKVRRNVITGVVVLFAILIGLFLIALVLSLFFGEGFGDAVRVIRDLVIILLALEGALIVLALAILVLQVARLVNLLQSEVKPFIENTQSTLATVRGTVEFMSENVTEPLVKASGFFASVSSFVAAGFGLRGAVKKARTENRAAREAGGENA